MDYVEHRWIYRNKLEKRDYQIDIAKKSLSGNMLVVLPTGLGKTAIAILASAYHLERDMYGKILVVAPTRPLVEQHRKSFMEFLKIGEDELKVVTGKAKPEERAEMYRKADIVFATPQTISNDIKKRRINLKDFQLLIVDEAHRSVGNYSYTYVSKMFRLQNPFGHVLGLTASPSSDRAKIREIQQSLGISIVEIRDEQDEDVRKYVQDISMDYVYVDIPPYIDALRAYIVRIIDDREKKLRKMGFSDASRNRYKLLMLQKSLSRKKSGSSFFAISLISEMLKLEHAVGLVESHSIRAFHEYLKSLHKEGTEGRTKASARIIKEFSFQKAVSLSAELLDEGKEHPKIRKLMDIVEKNREKKMIIFTQYRVTAGVIHEHLSGMVKSSVFIGQNRGMKQDEQKEIIRKFREGDITCLISTSIGEEGLDIPEVDLVIFYEPVPSEIRYIQRRGRTGRKRAGRVIVLVARGTRDERYMWSAYHKTKRMKKIMKSMNEESNLGRWYSG